MPPFVMSWLASKTAGPIILILAAIAVPLAVVQTVRIEGFPLLGQGLKAEVSDLHELIEDPETGYIAKLTQARANGAQLDAGLKACNAGVAHLKSAGDKAEADWKKQLDESRAQTKGAQARAARILAARPGPDLCGDADALILGTLP